MGLDCVSELRPLTGLLRCMSKKSHVGMMQTGENWKTRRKACPSATLPQIPHGSKPGPPRPEVMTRPADTLQRVFASFEHRLQLCLVRWCRSLPGPCETECIFTRTEVCTYNCCINSGCIAENLGSLARGSPCIYLPSLCVVIICFASSECQWYLIYLNLI
jgi:hypothetical protein